MVAKSAVQMYIFPVFFLLGFGPGPKKIVFIELYPFPDKWVTRNHSAIARQFYTDKDFKVVGSMFF